MKSAGLLTDGAWREQDFFAAETLEPHSDAVASGSPQVFPLLVPSTVDFSSERSEAQLHLDTAHNLAHRGAGGRVALFNEDPPQRLRKVAASQIRTKNSTKQCVTVVNRNCVRQTVAGVYRDTRRASRRAQRQNSLDRHVLAGRATPELLVHTLEDDGLRDEPAVPADTGSRVLPGTMCPLADRNSARSRVLPDTMCPHARDFVRPRPANPSEGWHETSCAEAPQQH